MGKVILYLCGICFVLITVVGLFQDYGWGVILWPLGVLAAGGVLLLFASSVYGLATAPQRKALHIKEQVGRLEAEQGIAVPTEGICRQCGKPLVVGAKFCAYCKTPTALVALICPSCKMRNPEDAVFCAECGADLRLTEVASQPTKQPKSKQTTSRVIQGPWTCTFCLGRNAPATGASMGAETDFICRHCGKPDPALAPKLARDYEKQYEQARRRKA